jgi:hypothetical protein
MLVIGDPEEVGPKTYVGLFDSPIVAGDYAKKHFKGKRWIVEYINIAVE